MEPNKRKRDDDFVDPIQQQLLNSVNGYGTGSDKPIEELLDEILLDEVKLLNGSKYEKNFEDVRRFYRFFRKYRNRRI